MQMENKSFRIDFFFPADCYGSAKIRPASLPSDSVCVAEMVAKVDFVLLIFYEDYIMPCLTPVKAFNPKK